MAHNNDANPEVLNVGNNKTIVSINMINMTKLSSTNYIT